MAQRFPVAGVTANTASPTQNRYPPPQNSNIRQYAGPNFPVRLTSNFVTSCMNFY